MKRLRTLFYKILTKIVKREKTVFISPVSFPQALSKHKIPNIIHFCFGLEKDFGNIPFSFVHYLAIRLAYEINKPDAIFLFYKYEPKGKWWEESKRFLTLIKVEPPNSIFGNPLCHYAHKADVVRLEILLKYGGIYLDLDVLCLKPFSPLLNYDFLMGMQGKRGLCNAVILSVPNSEFLKIWYEAYVSFRSFGRDEYWDEHSVIVPFELAKENPQLIHIEDERSFFWPNWDQVEILLEGTGGDFTKSYCIHLAETRSWNKYLKDLTPERLKKMDNDFAGLFKNYISL